eukprot:TRINITY_DN11287_c0_g1_i1.p1 TRINITY_DN11287_c0_g1~~TRINITY_DN11287_c0_g1_i1.p1  ORF type:complete len:690 (+),score=182.70 TRINITY_DN11287_c0_g1_i1:44-2113(+)
MSSRSGHVIQRCLYDVLELSRSCTDDEIRLAYRKLALRWHPDKNVGNQEEATVRFKEIQNAYSILSDKNERAWYDSHRESILRGVNVEEGEDEEINLWPYFSTSIYTGYGDDEQGFYFTYATIFRKIDEIEEINHASDESYRSAPGFGDSKTPYAQVSAFYAYWTDFISRRTFSQVDKYNLSTAPSRQIKRLMEKENKKERDAARKEYTDCVRQLAQFVKKRDRRILEHQLKQQKLAEERAREQAEAALLDKQAREKAAEALRLEHEEHMKELDAHLEKFGIHELAKEYDKQSKKGATSQKKAMTGDGGEEVDELYCLACKKKFKSEQQWKNHEKSKKHLDKVAELRQQVLLEEDLLEPNEDISDQVHTPQIPESDPTLSAEMDEDYFDIQPTDLVPSIESLEREEDIPVGANKEHKKEAPVASTKGKERKKQAQKQAKKQPPAPADQSKSRLNTNRSNTKGQQPQHRKESIESESSENQDGSEEDDDILAHMVAQMAKRTTKTKLEDDSQSDEDDRSIDENGQENGQDSDSAAALGSGEDKDGDNEDEAQIDDEEDTEAGTKDEEENSDESEAETKVPLSKERIQEDAAIGKKQKQKQKQKTTVQPSSSAKKPTADEEDRDSTKKQKKSKQTSEPSGGAPKQSCRICGAEFNSRNALFAHVKETGHAIAEGYAGRSAPASAKGKRKGK